MIAAPAIARGGLRAPALARPFRPRAGSGFDIAGLFAGGARGVWIDAGGADALYRDTLGLKRATQAGDTVALALDRAGWGGKTLAEVLTARYGIPTMYRGLEGPFDYYVDGANGADANAGTSEAAAWRKLGPKLTTAILAAGRTTRVLVKAAAYTDQTIANLSGAPVGSVLEIVFEPGCTVQWTLGTSTSAAEAGTNATLRLLGNGLHISGFNTGTGNGLGCFDNGVLEAYDCLVTNCVDGVSAHGTGVLRVHDCTFRGNLKYNVAHIASSRTEHYRCVFDDSAGASTYGCGLVSDPGTQARFEDCAFLPGPTAVNLKLNNSTLVRCQVGTPARRFALVPDSGTATTLTACFVNAAQDANRVLSFDACFGFLSLRQRNGGAITLRNSVIAGPATGQANVIYSNYNPGAGSPFVIENTIFAGSYTLMAVDAANAGHMVAAGSRFRNNLLSHGKVYDADLVAAGANISGTVSGDPRIGPANTARMADFAFGAGSPATGAGTGGADIGFGAAAVAERAPQQQRGPGGVPGAHAVQAVAAARPVLGAQGGRRWLAFDGADDALSVTLPDLGGAASEGWSDAGGVTVNAGLTIGAGTRTLPARPALHGYVALDRALTAGEAAGLSALGRA